MTDKQPTYNNSYFGKNTGCLSQRYMWLWMDHRLHVQQGSEHGKDLGWEQQDVEMYYRGWFDPIMQEMFVISPRVSKGHVTSALRGIPRILDRALRRRFGEDFTYRLF